MSAPYKGLEKLSETLLPTNLSLPCHLRLITAIFVSCDLSFGSDFLRQRCTSVPFFQSAFQIKTDVKIHAVAAAQCWGSNTGLVRTRKVFYHDFSEAPLGANGVRGALRNCPPSRPQLSLSSANLSSQLTLSNSDYGTGFCCRCGHTTRTRLPLPQAPPLLHLQASGLHTCPMVQGTMPRGSWEIGAPQLFSSSRNPSNYSCRGFSLTVQG